MRRLSSYALVPSALALLSSPAALRAEIIEKVVAKVNGQIITLSEFQSRQLAAAQAARVDPTTVGQFLRQNNARILQDAIDELLIMQKAEDAGMKAPSPYIDEAIESIKKDNNITSEEQFQDALQREGLTLSELRQNIERSIVRRMVMERDIRPRVEVSEAEMQAEYEKLKATEFTKPATVTLQEILVKEEQGGLRLARELVEKARAGEDFEALARQHSAAASRSNGGDLGQITENDMHPDLRQVANSLPVGGVSDPLPVADGYRIVRVVAKTSGSTTPFEGAREKVRDRLMMQRFEKEYAAYLGELRKTSQVELRVREVPLQLTGPIPEGSLLETLGEAGPAASPAGPGAAPAAAPGATDTIVIPTEKKPVAPPPAAVGDDEISTTGSTGPERVAPPTAPPATPPANTATPPPPAKPGESKPPGD
jgi:parvulin-like peptidyl-prolyl isomerase